MDIRAILSAINLSTIIALAAVLIAFVFRRPLARGSMVLILAGLRRRNIEKYRQIKSCLLIPLSYMIFTGVTRIAIDYINIPDKQQTVLGNVFASLFMAMAFWALYSAAGFGAAQLMDTSRQRENRINPTAVNFVSGAVRITIAVMAVLMILSRWVPDISGLIAGLGIGGLAIALAAQDTASNLFGSVSIMLDRPFEIGDWVELEGVQGVVERIGLRSSRIRALDQSIVFIPNSKLANMRISNGTKRSKRRVAFNLSLMYATPPDAIQAYIDKIKEILAADPDVLEEGLLVAFESCADSSLQIFICYYTFDDYVAMLAVKERINFALLRAAQEVGVSMAVPSAYVYRES